MYKPEQFAWLGEKRYNKYSQFGEDGILEAIFERIGTVNRWCCECGAADGIRFSNTRMLLEEGWSSLQIEADAELFKKLDALCEQLPSEQVVICLNEKVGLQSDKTFDHFLQDASVPTDLDLLVIDVDGQDYWLFNSLVKYRPRVIMVEYDPLAARDFIPPQNGERQAGLDAIITLGVGKYYWPVAITSTNVIFVQQELCGNLVAVDELVACEECGKSVEDTSKGRCSECYEKEYGQFPTITGVPWGEFRRSGEAYHGELLCSVCSKPFKQNEDWLVCSTACMHKAAELGKPPRKRDADENGNLLPWPKVAAVMSTPRVGPLATMDAIFAGIARFNIPLLRGEGAFWHQNLTRGIEKALEGGADYILTLDYDTVFTAGATDSAVAQLIVLMRDNPEVDIIVAAQMKREGGPLLATSDKEIALLDPLIPIQQGHFGLTLFRRSVFERLPKPWLRDEPNEKGEWNENRIDADIYFWRKCVEHGINIQMSLDVLIGHMEWVVTWPGPNLQPVYQPLNDWREHGKPAGIFDRQAVIAAVKANPALLYGASAKLDMGG